MVVIATLSMTLLLIPKKKKNNNNDKLKFSVIDMIFLLQLKFDAGKKSNVAALYDFNNLFDTT